jgi:hypothetical protein
MATSFVLWGWTRRWSGGLNQPLRIMAGPLRDCRTRQTQFRSDYDDALTGIYATGDTPEALRLQVAERVCS